MSKPNRWSKLWQLRDLLSHCNSGEVQTNVGGKWLPARPVGYPSVLNRLYLAWMVFRGRADAVIWPEDDPEYQEEE